MKKYGFEQDVVIKQIDYKRIFKKADTIKMMYVSAYGFFNDIEKIALIESAAQRGASMKFLFAKKHTRFIEDLMAIERKNGTRTFDKDINDEEDEVNAKINEIRKKFPDANIEIKYFSSEFRLPMIIASFKIKNEYKTYGYLNITFPPMLSKDHILLSGTASQDELEVNNNYNQDEPEDNKNIVKMMNDHFDSVWDISSTSKD